MCVFTSTDVKNFPADQVSTIGNPVMSGKCEGGVYVMDLPTKETTSASAFVADVVPENSFTKWHARLGHCSNSVLKMMMNHGSVQGLSFTKAEAKKHVCSGICNACALGKMTMKPVRRHPENVVSSTAVSSQSSTTIISPGRLVLMDLLASPVPSMGGSMFALVLVDADTKYSWIYFQKTKTDEETLKNIEHWTKIVRRDGIVMTAFSTLRSDNGGEFVNEKVSAFLLEKGIRKETCPPYAHVHMVERALRTIQDNTRAMLFHAKMSPTFWAESASAAVYLFNRTINKNNQFHTPYQLYYGQKPSVSHLRTFGCICYVRNYPHLIKKWDHRAVKCRFVGYGDEHDSPKTWKLVDISTNRFINSGNVIFDETMNQSKVEIDAALHNIFPFDDLLVPPPLPPLPPPTAEPTRRERLEAELEAQPVASRTRQNYHAMIAMALKAKTKHAAELREPATVTQALNSPAKEEWQKAINAENESLLKNGTFTVERLKSGIHALGLKWVFKLKTDADGNIQRYKARCTALGNLQKAGVDYDELFSPVVHYSTLRALLAMSAQKGYFVHNMDVDTAFLYGSLPQDEIVYVKLPHGYPVPPHLSMVPREDLVCKVNKSIYGLKQSPRLWNQTIDKFMLDSGFKKSKHDSCLYSRSTNGEDLFVAIYVDDLVMSGSSLNCIEMFKSELKRRFNMKDLGQLSFCLGMEIAQDREKGTIKLSQAKYISDVLRRFGMTSCHPSPVPMQPGLQLFSSSVPDTSGYPYREVVGSLMYLMTSTRPDIAFAVSKLAKFLNCHGAEHHAAAQQVLRYLKATQDLGLVYQKSEQPQDLLCYSDSDWASDVETRRSTTGYIFILSGAPISWKSRLQPTVALSSTEAEYMALSATTQESIHIRNVCLDLKAISSGHITIFGDNQGSIAMAKNPVNHKTAKHIAIRHHFVREKVDSGEVNLEYCPTESMFADFLTKALSKVVFYKLRDSAMGMTGRKPKEA